ncbi:MAG: ferrous iron transport protein A [Candidatus Bathyarchaeota archaeon]|nr:ferrous iron transport protein A [Candidatus Bathyarchaeota archaeon]
MPLSALPFGCEAKITRVCGGCSLAKRLTEMGLTCGTKIKIVCEGNLHSGPVLVEVRDSRLVLGRGVATKIFVEENP